MVRIQNSFSCMDFIASILCFENDLSKFCIANIYIFGVHIWVVVRFLWLLHTRYVSIPYTRFYHSFFVSITSRLGCAFFQLYGCRSCDLAFHILPGIHTFSDGNVSIFGCMRTLTVIAFSCRFTFLFFGIPYFCVVDHKQHKLALKCSAA